MLLNVLTEEQCRSLFLKQPNKQQASKIADLLEDLQENLVQSSEESRARIDKQFAELESERKKYQEDCKGRRVDVQVIDMNANPPLELLIDTTSIHPTCKSRLRAEVKSTTHNIELLAAANGLRDAHKPHPVGAAVTSQAHLKRDKYAGLVALATRQQLEGRRATKVSFKAAVCSTLGELSPGFFSVQESICRMHSNKLNREGPRLDGYSAAQLTATFRSSFKCAIQMAVAKGFATMLLEAGLPFSKR